jgi:hypothetical protein
MKKHVFHLLAALVLLAAGSAYAQLSSKPIKVNIPFDFRAGNITLPAGEYRLDTIYATGSLVLSGTDSQRMLVHFNAAETLVASSSTKLIFHRYGDRYFLHEVWVQGENRGRELPATRLEKEIASNARPRSVAILANK